MNTSKPGFEEREREKEGWRLLNFPMSQSSPSVMADTDEVVCIDLCASSSSSSDSDTMDDDDDEVKVLQQHFNNNTTSRAAAAATGNDEASASSSVDGNPANKKLRPCQNSYWEVDEEDNSEIAVSSSSLSIVAATTTTTDTTSCTIVFNPYSKNDNNNKKRSIVLTQERSKVAAASAAAAAGSNSSDRIEGAPTHQLSLPQVQDGQQQQQQQLPLLVFLNGDDVAAGHGDNVVVTVTEGLMQLLQGLVATQRSQCRGSGLPRRRCFLFGGHHTGTQAAVAPMLHVEQRDRWSCGYRNVQMLLSALLPLLPNHHPYHFSSSSSSGTYVGSSSASIPYVNNDRSAVVAVPSLRDIQRTMEAMWAAGYDASGAGHYGGTLVGKPTWIGAVEVSNCLTFCGIDNTVVQFIVCPQSRMQLLAFCRAYFRKKLQLVQQAGGGGGICSCCGGSGEFLCERSRDVVDRVFRDMEMTPPTATTKAASAAIDQPSSPLCNCPTFPLYLQWKGHSVTVVGVEVARIPNSSGGGGEENDVGVATNLLVWDPMMSGGRLKTALERNDVGPLRLNPLDARLRHRDWQLVVVTTRPIPGDQNALKMQVCVRTAAGDAVSSTIKN
jgi:Peptidase family C78